MEALRRIVVKRWPGASINILVNDPGGSRPGCLSGAGASENIGRRLEWADWVGRLKWMSRGHALHAFNRLASFTACPRRAASAAAGTAPPHASLLSGSHDDWVDTVNTTILGTAFVIREAVADMERSGSPGQVVQIACTEEGSGVHAVSQQALCAMAEELRWAAGTWRRGPCLHAPGAVRLLVLQRLVLPCCRAAGAAARQLLLLSCKGAPSVQR